MCVLIFLEATSSTLKNFLVSPTEVRWMYVNIEVKLSLFSGHIWQEDPFSNVIYPLKIKWYLFVVDDYLNQKNVCENERFKRFSRSPNSLRWNTATARKKVVIFMTPGTDQALIFIYYQIALFSSKWFHLFYSRAFIYVWRSISANYMTKK